MYVSIHLSIYLSISIYIYIYYVYIYTYYLKDEPFLGWQRRVRLSARTNRKSLLCKGKCEGQSSRPRFERASRAGGSMHLGLGEEVIELRARHLDLEHCGGLDSEFRGGFGVLGWGQLIATFQVECLKV
jgi:hypothetical protein